MFSREETRMAATAGPSSEGPDDDAVVDETTLRFILVRALSARSKPRDPTPVSDAYRGGARRAPGARAAGESNPPSDSWTRRIVFFVRRRSVVESSNDSSVSRPSTSASLPRR